jgi:adenylate kinase
MDRGELVDDATMIEIVRNRLQQPDTKAGFVLDGFPRTVPQARALDEIIGERGNGPLVVVDVVVPEKELMRRLAGRRICSKCGTKRGAVRGGRAAGMRKCGGALVQRTDDNDQVVSERLKVLHPPDAAAGRLLSRASDVSHRQRRAGPRSGGARARHGDWRRGRGGCGAARTERT